MVALAALAVRCASPGIELFPAHLQGALEHLYQLTLIGEKLFCVAVEFHSAADAINRSNARRRG